MSSETNVNAYSLVGDERASPRERRSRGAPEVVELTNVAVELLEGCEESDRDALEFVDSLGVIEPVKFSRLRREAEWWADLVRARGLHPGNRVAVMAGDSAWTSTLLGVLEAGCVALPFPATAPVAELRASAGEAGAVAFASNRARPDLVEPDGIPVLSRDELDSRRDPSRLRHMAMPGDAALIIDGAAYSHGALLAQADAAAQWLELRAGERVWSTTSSRRLARVDLAPACSVARRRRDRRRRGIARPARAARVAAQVPARRRVVLRHRVRAPLPKPPPPILRGRNPGRSAALWQATRVPSGPSWFGRGFGVEIALASAGPLAGLVAEAGPLPAVVAEPESAETRKRRRKEEKLAAAQREGGGEEASEG